MRSVPILGITDSHALRTLLVKPHPVKQDTLKVQLAVPFRTKVFRAVPPTSASLGKQNCSDQQAGPVATVTGLPNSEPARSGVLICLACSSCIPISERDALWRNSVLRLIRMSKPQRARQSMFTEEKDDPICAA